MVAKGTVGNVPGTCRTKCWQCDNDGVCAQKLVQPFPVLSIHGKQSMAATSACSFKTGKLVARHQPPLSNACSIEGRSAHLNSTLLLGQALRHVMHSTQFLLSCS